MTPDAALKIIIQKLKGQTVTAGQLIMAGTVLIGYIAQLFTGDNDPKFAAMASKHAINNDQMAAELESHLASNKPMTSATLPPWLLPLLLKVLQDVIGVIA